MLKLLNVIDIFGMGLDLNFNDTVFWLYIAQGALVFIGIIMFFILLARTRSRSERSERSERVVLVEKVVEEQPVEEKRKKKKKDNKEEPVVVVEDTAATAAVEPQPQPQVIVLNSASTETEKEEVRVLTGITLDVGVVQREFTVGEDFNCDGLLVRANYNLEPLTETIIAYSVVDNDTYERLSNVKDIKVCYVLRPNFDEAGIRFVTVKYADQTAIYTVAVKEAPKEESVTVEEAVSVEEAPTEPIVVEKVVEKIVEVEKPVVVEKVVEVEKPVIVERHETVIIDEESIEAGKLRYDKSFTARFIQSDDEVKHWYTQVKNQLLSYQKCKARTSWKRETFKANKRVVAMLAYRGKTLCLFLALNPADYADSKYDIEDASKIPAYVDTPVFIRLKNDKHVRMAEELITETMSQVHAEHKIGYVSQDFYMPYEGIVELINKGLVKREIKTAADEAIFQRSKQLDDEE